MTLRAAIGSAIALTMLATLALSVGQSGRAAVTAPAASAWNEIAWPFPMDQWGKGAAFRCKAADCGAEIVVYLRPKIGFCNCTTGVSDDAELERVADVSLFDERYTPLADGHTIKVGAMQGRSRPYRVDAGSRPKVLALAFNERCDVIVATALVASEQPAAFENAVLVLLNGDKVMRWVEVKLGL